VCRIEDERRILDAYGASNVTLWITEIGWTTTPGAPNAVSETEQVADVRTLFAMLRGQWRPGGRHSVYDYQTLRRVVKQRLTAMVCCGPTAPPSQLERVRRRTGGGF